MRHARNFVVFGILATALLYEQGCATKSGSGGGDEQMAQKERIGDPVIREIPPKDLDATTSRTNPATDAELSARNASGLATGLLMDVLFDFDRDSLRVDALPVLEANARRLKENDVSHVLLEGRGDEVGTNAYNMMLGERRANTVKSYLQQLGLTIDLKTTSYGKDRPLCFEHNSDCMQRNRSVHFVIKE